MEINEYILCLYMIVLWDFITGSGFIPLGIKLIISLICIFNWAGSETMLKAPYSKGSDAWRDNSVSPDSSKKGTLNENNKACSCESTKQSAGDAPESFREKPDTSPCSTRDNTANESDGETTATDEEKIIKRKTKISKERRQQIRTIKRSLSYAFSKLCDDVTKIKRVGSLASSRYLQKVTQHIQRDTVFKNKFFCYKHEKIRRLVVKLMEEDFALNRMQAAADSDLVVAAVVHMYSWPIPFPVMRYRDVSKYAQTVRAKNTELKNLQKMLSCWSSKNKAFVEVRLLSLLAFAAIGDGKFGIASDYLEEGCVLATSLESCEWTAWLYLAQAFLYICWADQTSNDELYDNALPYLDIARNHFMEDAEKGATFNIAAALILWWMFLIKCRAIRCSWSDERCFNGMCKHRRFVGLTEEDMENASTLLKMFQEEAEKVMQFQDQNLFGTIIDIFEQHKHGGTTNARHQHKLSPGVLKPKLCLRKQQSATISSDDEEKLETGDKKLLKKHEDKAIKSAATKEKVCSTTDVVEQSFTARQAAYDKDIVQDSGEIQMMYKKLLEAINGKVPAIIQSSYVLSEDKVQLIVINVDEGSKDDATKFISQQSPSIFKSVNIMLVEQPCFPEDCMLDDEGGDNKKLSDLPGTEFGVSVGTDVACTHKNGDQKMPGTLGGFLYDKKSVFPGQLYGCTAGHVLTGSLNNVPSVGKKSCILFLECVNKHKPQYFCEEVSIGSYSEEGDIGDYNIDVGLIPLDNNVVRNKTTRFLQNKRNQYVSLEAFKGPYKDIKNKVVHKAGKHLDQTVGTIVEVDLKRNFKGYVMSGYFVVKPTGKVTAFAQKGHSGAWVTDVITEQRQVSVYGILQGKQDRFRRVVVKDGAPVVVDEPLGVGLCLHFHNQITALNKRCKTDLVIYNSQIDLQMANGRVTGGSWCSSKKSDVKDSKEKMVITCIRPETEVQMDQRKKAESENKSSSPATVVEDLGVVDSGEKVGVSDESGYSTTKTSSAATEVEDCGAAARAKKVGSHKRSASRLMDIAESETDLSQSERDPRKKNLDPVNTDSGMEGLSGDKSVSDSDD